jgi:hypothetical protein
MNNLCIFKDDFENGIGNVSISHDKKLIAAIGLDENHTLVIYDLEKAMKAKLDPKSISFFLLIFLKA